MINPYIILAAVLAFIGAYGVGRWDGASACARSQLKAEQVAHAAADAAMKSAAEAIAKIEVRNVTIRQRVEREIIEKPVYRDCRHDANVVRDLNDALAGKPPSDGKLPSTTPPASR